MTKWIDIEFENCAHAVNILIDRAWILGEAPTHIICSPLVRKHLETDCVLECERKEGMLTSFRGLKIIEANMKEGFITLGTEVK